MIHRPLDDELKVLRGLLQEMLYLVDEQLSDALSALLARDATQAARVASRDDEIDALELKVDRQCERILALHQPVASDLRLILLATKISTDLERIGDHSRNLARLTERVQEEANLPLRALLEELGEAVRALLRQAQDALSQEDRVLARQVMAGDQHINRIYRDVFDRLVTYAQQHPETMATTARLLVMAKGLERVADHAKNIAKRVVFLVEGLDVRHGRLPRPE